MCVCYHLGHVNSPGKKPYYTDNNISKTYQFWPQAHVSRRRLSLRLTLTVSQLIVRFIPQVKKIKEDLISSHNKCIHLRRHFMDSDLKLSHVKLPLIRYPSVISKESKFFLQKHSRLFVKCLKQQSFNIDLLNFN